jgi:misacylated tRNA(Ala) deacylase
MTLARCCGTHLPTLSTLRVFIIPRVESVSGGQYRIYFLAGPRLVAYLAQIHVGLHDTASGLGCSVSQAPDRARQEVQQRTRANKRVEAVEEELGALIADKILREADETAKSGSLFRKYLSRTDDSPNPLGVVNAIVKAFSRSVALEETRRPHLVVISSSPSVPNSSATTVLVAFGSEERMIKDLGDQLRQIGVKGGGSGSRFNGKAVGWKDSVDGQRLQRILEEIGT